MYSNILKIIQMYFEYIDTYKQCVTAIFNNRRRLLVSVARTTYTV